jgi:hypothetical protein
MPVNRASAKPKTKEVFGHLRKPSKMLRAGLYARVSTLDQQTLPMQMRAMRDTLRTAAGLSPCRSKKLGLVPRSASSDNS